MLKKTIAKRNQPLKQMKRSPKMVGKEPLPPRPSRSKKNLVSAPITQNKSSSQSGRDRDRYVESERIGTVSGSVAFLVGIISQMNPGLSGSFPWLSGHAALYEKYKVNKLIYRYKNLKGTQTDGNILMGFDYDVLDAPPSDAIELTQLTEWVDGAPWRIFEFRVPTDGRVLFTRTGPVAGADLKTYDMGQLFVASEACADTSETGYLEVEYDISFFNKQSSKSSVAPSFTTSSFSLTGDADVSALGQNQISLWSNFSGNNGVIFDTVNHQFTVPQGNWLVTSYGSVDSGASSGLVDFNLDISGNSLALTPQGPTVAFGGTGPINVLGQFLFSNPGPGNCIVKTYLNAAMASAGLIYPRAGAFLTFQTV